MTRVTGADTMPSVAAMYADVDEDGAAHLHVAARIFLQAPASRHALASADVPVGDAAVRRVAERLAGGSPELLARLRRAVVRHEQGQTSRTREQVVEAVTSVALSLPGPAERDPRTPLPEGRGA